MYSKNVIRKLPENPWINIITEQEKVKYYIIGK
jgi:hypothetical protein